VKNDLNNSKNISASKGGKKQGGVATVRRGSDLRSGNAKK
jgi:hypothetical protein